MGVYQRRYYELMLLYNLGLTPKGVIRLGYKRGIAYRWHAIYIKARQRAIEVILRKDSVSLK